MSTQDKLIEMQKDKVYTSYYAYACKILPGHRMVAISLGIPDNFTGEIYRELNPSKELLYAYKNGKISSEEYTRWYKTEVLNNLDPMDVYNRLKGKAALCYCGKDSFCHRKLVASWLAEQIGSEIIGGEL